MKRKKIAELHTPCFHFKSLPSQWWAFLNQIRVPFKSENVISMTHTSSTFCHLKRHSIADCLSFYENFMGKQGKAGSRAYNVTKQTNKDIAYQTNCV